MSLPAPPRAARTGGGGGADDDDDPFSAFAPATTTRNPLAAPPPPLPPSTRYVAFETEEDDRGSSRLRSGPLSSSAAAVGGPSSSSSSGSSSLAALWRTVSRRLRRSQAGAADDAHFQRVASSSSATRGRDGRDADDDDSDGDDDEAAAEGNDSAGRWCPEAHASPLGRLLFTHVSPLVALGSRKPLEAEDLPGLRPGDSAREASAALRHALERLAPVSSNGSSSRSNNHNLLPRAILAVHGRTLLWTAALKVAHDAVMFASPWLLRQLLSHLHASTDHHAAAAEEAAASGASSSTPAPDADSRLVALKWATLLLIAGTLEVLTINAYFEALFRVSLHLKAALTDLLYSKSLRLSAAARSRRGVGAVANLQSNDAAKLWALPTYAHMVWNAPFQIAVVMSMLVSVLGAWPALAGASVTIAMIPPTAWFGRRLAAVRREMVAFTDRRVKLEAEVVTGVRAIKIYAYEPAYGERIDELREQELRSVRRSALLSLTNSVLVSSAPVLVAIAAFGTFAWLGGALTADVAFPALALFNLLRFPLIMLPTQLGNLVAAHVAVGRLGEFLGEDEAEAPARLGAARGGLKQAAARLRRRREQQQLLQGQQGAQEEQLQQQFEQQQQEKDEGEEEDAIVVDGADFYFGREPPPPAPSAGRGSSVAVSLPEAASSSSFALRDVRLRVPAGSLVVVVGPVGSGKSALLLALLGEMHARPSSSSSCPPSSPLVTVRGTLSYTQQDPYILNATVRDNVLMGLSFDAARYARAIQSAALAPDLARLPGGDRAEIGEKGVNLSGGQRHRVALARAAYSRADVALLDDPLSAVDAHVARQLFFGLLEGEDMLGGGKTVVLATHQAQWAREADLVVVMKDGRIEHCCAPEELAARGVDLGALELAVGAEGGAGGGKGGDDDDDEDADDDADDDDDEEDGGAKKDQKAPSAVAVVSADATAAGVAAAAKLGGGGGKGDDASASAAAAKKQQEQEGKLTQAEAREVGRVRRAIYGAYFRAWGPHCVLPLALATAALSERGLQVLQNLVLAGWSNSTGRAQAAAVASAAAAAGNVTAAGNATAAAAPPPAPLPPPTTTTTTTPLPAHATERFLALYLALGLLSVAVGLARAFALVEGATRAARTLHARLLRKVLRLPMAFFDRTPQGRLLNRFSKDTEAADTQLPGVVNSALSCAVSAGYSVAVVLGAAPASALAIFPIAILYLRLQRLYVGCSREVKRVDSISQSPVFSHFAESLQGLVTIRAYRRQRHFARRSRRLLDGAARPWWQIQSLNRWLSVRLEMMGNGVVFAAAAAVGAVQQRSPGMAGLGVSSAMALTGTVSWLLRQISELEINMNAVERLVEYDGEREEAPALGEGAVESAAAGGGRQHQHVSLLPRGWPSYGALAVENLVVRYRPDLPPVLRGVSFAVDGGQKLGVVGRTGCGKSTLVLALLRLVEPDRGGGAGAAGAVPQSRVTLDGVDLCSDPRVGLRDLRRAISLVPQDPTVFSGTVRSNLDPFHESASDADVWESLRRAGLEPYVRGLPGGLDAPVREGGANFSGGQRQLLAMARALLRRSKVLVLDEATSSVSAAEDALIQRSLRESFASSTVLTIAHRLGTILDYDLTLVLDAGRVAEFAPPGELLAKPGGVFAAMVAASRARRRERRRASLEQQQSGGGSGGGVAA
jgi:ATP-binding cassette subfamily C (CFTR/MRP) protein 1